ncbi:hypothetical protein [Agromyces seonyuensis]|uniref:Class I SAM-dependent methyltransferase n=1 Tax=Agromyces seonyuensis TaxID=2662446 RepID=A0A6I4NWA6_9MICO|nr:hypothetical protein [Agromyces seonyuensis]MWB98618.1 hypothetical protein [Agromyces seonyuensis]
MGDPGTEVDDEVEIAPDTRNDDSATDDTAGTAPPRRPRDVEATAALTELIWQRAADALLVRTRPQFDEIVLDVGTGAASVPSAALVGPGGRVDAVLRDQALALRARADAGEALPQLALHRLGLADWGFGSYDVVQLALALDVVGDDEVERTAADLVSRVRPGGRIGFLVWAGRAFAELIPAVVEAAGPFDERLGAADPADLGPSVRHVGEPGSFAARLADLGLTGIHADELPRTEPVDPDLAWSIVVGTELVHLLDGVDGEDLPAVQEAFTAAIAREGVDSVDLSMLAGVGTVPPVE